MLAWLAVVVLQAIIHFGIIGPRSRRWRREEETNEEIETDDPTTTTEDLPQEAHVSGFQKFSPSKVPRTEHQGDFFSKPQSSALGDDSSHQICAEDERDTSEEMKPCSSLLSQEGYFAGQQVPRNSMKYRSSANSSINTDDPAYDANGYDTDDDCIDGEEFTGNEYDDEDERFRFELVRRYYSCPSIVPHVEPRRRYERSESSMDDSSPTDYENATVLKARNYEENISNSGILHRRGSRDATKKHVAFSMGSDDDDKQHRLSAPFSIHSMGIACA